MKVIIFAGGSGSRLSEETAIKPKPMVEICGKPILLHIMEHYASFGYKEFIVLGGYKCEYIKDYFKTFNEKMLNFTVKLDTNEITYHKPIDYDFTVTVLDTGINTLTGTRLLKAKDYIGTDEPFMLTYGDGISDINIHELTAEAASADKILTISIVSPKMRFGTVELDNNNDIVNFHEKMNNHDKINGGFMVVKPDIFKYIPKNKNVMFEDIPMQSVTKINQCHAYIPSTDIYWHAIDTLKDKLEVEKYLLEK